MQVKTTKMQHHMSSGMSILKDQKSELLGFNRILIAGENKKKCAATL
jgi:hypothetical protein